MALALPVVTIPVVVAVFEAELAAAAGGSGLTASRPPSSGSGKIDTPFRIVGLVVHYSDHGVRGEGTDRPKDR